MVEEYVWNTDPHVADVALMGRSEAAYLRYKHFGIGELENLVAGKIVARFVMNSTAAFNESCVWLQMTRSRFHRDLNGRVIGVDAHAKM